MDQFKCVRCGNCCMWEGLVRVSDAEIELIANHLKISISKFIENYTTISYDRKGLCLIDNPTTGHCIFLEQDPAACKIQAVKPIQCSNFPHAWNFEGWEKHCKGSSGQKEKKD